MRGWPARVARFACRSALRRIVVFAGVLAGSWLLGSLGAALAEEARVAPDPEAAAVHEIGSTEVADSVSAGADAAGAVVENRDGEATSSGRVAQHGRQVAGAVGDSGDDRRSTVTDPLPETGASLPDNVAEDAVSEGEAQRQDRPDDSVAPGPDPGPSDGTLVTAADDAGDGTGTITDSTAGPASSNADPAGGADRKHPAGYGSGDSDPAQRTAPQGHVDDADGSGADGSGTTVKEESSFTPSPGSVAGYLLTHGGSADDTGYRVRVPEGPHVVAPDTADDPSFSPD